MPRRKEPTYNDYARQIESLQAKMAERRERMVQVLSSVLDEKVAAALGDLSDTELQKVMELIVEDISVYVDRVIANRHPRSAPKAKTSPIPESAPKPAEKPAQAATSVPTAKSVDPSVQAAVKAPADTQPAPAPKPSVQPGQAASNAPADKPVIKMPNYPLVNGEMRFNNEEQRWGIWNKDSDDWYIPIAPFGMTLEVYTDNEWYKGTLAVVKDRFGKFECISTTDASGVPFHIVLNTARRVRSVQSTQ